MDGKIGHWAFLVGVLVAIIVGLVPSAAASPVVPWVLLVVGLLIGFLNVTEKETTGFLVAAVALVVVSDASNVARLGMTVTSILSSIGAVVSPAAVVVALKAVYAMAND